MDAVIYARWSTTEQRNGSTLERQLELGRSHCAAKGWRIAEELRDDGVSAWTGANTVDGKLAGFVEAVRNGGRYPAGVVLVVEQLDRLSRRPVMDMLDWIRGTVRLGIRISSVVGDTLIENDRFDLATIIRLAVEADVAHRQSEDKSRRIGAAWDAKRKRLASGDGQVMTRRAPAWLAVEGTPPRFRVIDDRADIVRRIFADTAGGLGKASIAARLNAEGVAPFGRARGWQASYIAKLVAGDAVLGTFTPGRKPRGAKRTAAGDPIAGYYPAIVDAGLHARARAAVAGRNKGSSGRGRQMVNLFGGLATCGACGGRMTFRGKGEKVRADGQVVNEDYLVCDARQRGLGCTNGQHFNYETFERQVLLELLERVVGDDYFAAPADARRLEGAIAAAEQRMRELATQRDRAMDAFLETGRPEVKGRWTTLAAEHDALDAELAGLRDELTIARGRIPPAQIATRIAGVRDELRSGDEAIRLAARAKVAAGLRELIVDMRFLASRRVVEMTLASGKAVSVEATSVGTLEALRDEAGRFMMWDATSISTLD